MDHVRLPYDYLFPHPQVEYLCRQDFQIPIGRFSDYPARRGLDKEQVILGNLSGLNGWEMESLAQEWLYFGLLSEILRIPGVVLQLGDFISTGHFDQPIITTALLLQYLQRWADSEKDNDHNFRVEHARQVNNLLNEAKVVINRLYRRGSEYEPMGPGGCIIIILCETLQYAANWIYESLTDRDNIWYPSKWPSRRMLMDGWCPNRISMLQQLLTTSGMYFASCLGGVNTTPGKHARCSEDRCLVHHLNRDTYKSQHLCDDSCEFIGPRADDIEAAVESGGVPLLRLVKSLSSGDVSVEIVRSDLKTPPRYVAISHVWSDGRGNLGSNTLPTCQMLHVHSKVSKLYSNVSEPILFWIDTICVPAAGEGRRVAIGRMRKTYENAEKVLVLDAELESASMRTFPEEILMRIMCSGWMRRLWTLQEGMLAQQLIFQFRECAVDFFSIEKDTEKVAERLDNVLALDVSRCGLHFQKLKNLKSDRMLEVVEALQWRNTSWKSDEPVCMSILLDLDTELIERTEPDLRMSAFLSMVKTFPAYLMFAPGPRLSQKNYSWAPASLMSVRGFPALKNPQANLAMQSNLGLILRLPALRLPRICTPLRDIAWFEMEVDTNMYRLTNLGAREDEGQSWAELGPHNIDYPVILRMGTLWEGQDDDWGALVSIHFEDERIIFAKFVVRVFISRENGEFPSEVLQRMKQAESLKDERTAWLGKVEHFQTDKKWLIT